MTSCEPAAGYDARRRVPSADASVRAGNQIVVTTTAGDEKTLDSIAATVEGIDFATLEHFRHDAENYELNAGLYIDRESLIKQKTAKVVVRPQLTLNGESVESAAKPSTYCTLQGSISQTINNPDCGPPPPPA